MGIEVWMPVYTGDILASCADMSPSQFGAYMRMLLYAWNSGGLPNDMEACCRIAGGCSPADWSVVRKRLIVLDEGTSAERLSQARLEQERAKQQGRHAAKVDAVAKARAAKASQNSDHNPVVNHDNNPDNNPVNRREPESEPESESESIRNATPTELLGATPQKRRRTYRITWTADAGFQGVTDADLTRWKTAYPGVNLTQETARAHAWLVDNPSKGGKRNWAAFLNRWFGRVQDKGGTAGHSPAPSKSFRPDAGREMTATEYGEWKRRRDVDAFVRSKSQRRGLSSLGDVIHGQAGGSADGGNDGGNQTGLGG